MTPPIRRGDGTPLAPSGIAQVRAGDGDVYYERNVIPDAVRTQYRYEDTADTTTALDSIGSNDATINGASYSTSTVKKESASIHIDNAGDSVESNNTVSLASDNVSEEVSVGGFIQPESVDLLFGPFWVADENNYFGIRERKGNYGAVLRVGGASSVIVESNTAISTGSWDHVFAVADASEIAIVVNGSTEETASHSFTLSNIGPATCRAGVLNSSLDGGTHYHDDTTFADKRLSESEIQTLIER